MLVETVHLREKERGGIGGREVEGELGVNHTHHIFSEFPLLEVRQL